MPGWNSPLSDTVFFRVGCEVERRVRVAVTVDLLVSGEGAAERKSRFAECLRADRNQWSHVNKLTTYL